MADVSKLGVYVIPGPSLEAKRAVVEAEEADRIGLGAVWESEMQSIMKDAGAICGYMGHATKRVRIGTSITHFTLRNPMILAQWGATMQLLTGNRFEFGFGRSFRVLFDAAGTPTPNLQLMEDYSNILRQMWRGEPVTYSGIAGNYKNMMYREIPDDFVPPPMHLAAIGVKTLALAGRCFDGVFFHPFMSEEAVAEKSAIVRRAAEEAGKDPAAVKIYHELVAAPDMTQDEIDEIIGARIAAYFSMPGLGKLILEANHWDEAKLGPYRAQVERSLADNASGKTNLKGRQVFVEAGKLFPEEWIAATAVQGTASDVAKGAQRFLDAGADELIFHGVTADRLGPTAEAFSAL